jgi:DNA mismatch repair protein MLH1
VSDGGLKLLQIKDNGCGIHAEDFPILCHRHTTSKLGGTDDLKRIRTLGFRGEALCSISFVSRLKVVSMRAGARMGHRAEFRDSEMTSTEPERCAAVQGTVITAEDMFYNVPNRLKAFSSTSQEFHLIYDVVAKYAVFCTGARSDI